MKNCLLKFWPVLAIIFLVAVFAFPYWAKGRIPFPADYLVDAFPPWQYFYALPVKNNAMPDVLGQMFPFKHLVIDSFKQGNLPLWNPYNFSGNPLLANYQSAAFHPANFLFFILPEIDAWSLMILLQPLLAGWFTYLLARQLKLSSLAAFLSGVAFMFCGFITVWLAYGTLSWALLWLPLILYGLEKIFQKASPLYLVLISLSLAASLFSGHFQTSIYVFLASFVFLIYRFLVSRDLKSFLVCFWGLFLGVLLASVQLLPTFEFYQHSSRSKVFGISEIVPWSYSPTVIAPDFYGNPVTRNDWFGHYAEWSSFIGVILLLLALYSVLAKKRKLVWFFVLLAAGSLLLTRPTPILDLIVKWKIPVLSSSAAARINSLFSFGVAILAGFGLDSLRRNLQQKKFMAAFTVIFLGLIGVLSGWAILLIKKPFLIEGLLIARRNFILPSGMVVGFAVLILLFWLANRFFSSKKLLLGRLRFLVLVGVVIFSVFDLFRFAQKWMPFDSRKHVYPSLPITEFLQKTLGHDRLFGFFGMEFQNYFQIQGFDGYDPLFIQRYGELMVAVGSEDHKIHLPTDRGAGLARRSPYTIKMLNLLGGKYVLHAIEDDHYGWAFDFWNYPKQFKQVYQDEKYEVYENLKVYPRAFMAYRYHLRNDSQEIINLLFVPEADLRRELILEEVPEKAEEIKTPKAESRVNIVSYSPNLVKIMVETETAGLLFLSDNYYPGWRAYIDNQPSKIYRADYSFRAITVPSGGHQVDFIYEPDSVKWGGRISLLALILLIGSGVSLSLLKKK